MTPIMSQRLFWVLGNDSEQFPTVCLKGTTCFVSESQLMLTWLLCTYLQCFLLSGFGRGRHTLFVRPIAKLIFDLKKEGERK